MKSRQKNSETNSPFVEFDPKNRRTFLKTAAGTFAIPFLGSLVPEKLLAQSAVPNRYVGISIPDQVPNGVIFPGRREFLQVAPAATNLYTYFQEGTNRYMEMNLASYIASRGNIGSVMDAKFNPYVSKMAIVAGVDFPGRLDHGLTCSFGNTAGSHLGTGFSLSPNYTIDQIFVRNIGSYPNVTDKDPGLTLSLGERATGNVDLGPGGRGIGTQSVPLSFGGNLHEVFTNYYKAGGGGAPPAVSMSRRKIVDLILAETNAVKNGSRTSATDKSLIESFQEGLFEIQRDLANAPPPTSCEAQTTPFLRLNPGPALMTMGDGQNNTRNYYRDLVRLISLFIKCDICRSFQVGINSSFINANSGVSHEGGSPRDWHSIQGHGHSPDIFNLAKWVYDNVVFGLVQALDTPEGTERYLDNTLIYTTSEMSFGHSGINMGAVLIGHKNLRGGYALNYADFSRGTADYHTGTGLNSLVAPGQPINRLWISILSALGVPTQAYFGKYGNPGNTMGPWVSNYTSGPAKEYEGPFADIVRNQLIGQALPRLLG